MHLLNPMRYIAVTMDIKNSYRSSFCAIEAGIKAAFAVCPIYRLHKAFPSLFALLTLNNRMAG
jgi:hypothetical protein